MGAPKILYLRFHYKDRPVNIRLQNNSFICCCDTVSINICHNLKWKKITKIFFTFVTTFDESFING